MAKQNTQTPIVVGIGASAGGLEALQDFFKHMPAKTGMAFVVIQHLSPDYRSLMDELLARETDIPIRIAESGMEVLGDHIYLLPPRKNIMIAGNILHLDEQEKGKRLNLPVDIFLRSLANDKGKNAIAVILSGTGSDGTLGTRAIKETGGMVMVQDEHSAKFDGMPRSSISTGLVDYILPPERMPEELVLYCRHPFVKQKKTLEDQLRGNMDTLAKIILILRQYCGIDFSFYKDTTIVRRLERRVSIKRLTSLDEYLEYVKDSDQEKEILQRELLIGVTRFFRDTEAFDSLRDKILPVLLANQSVRIWSAGCSTGEEVYSLAILIREFQASHGITGEVKIFATDIDRSSIEFAGRGIYPDSVMADVDPVLLNKYFIRKENGYLVHESIRKMIVFATHNILKDSPFSRIDLLVCRNLFIYLKPEIQTRVLTMFYYSLNNGGFLFMGSSETIGEMTAAFDCIDTKWKLFRFKEGFKPEYSTLIPLSRERASVQGQELSSTRSGPPGKRIERLLDSALTTLLPPSVIIDEQGNMIHIIKDVSPWIRLQPGHFSQNIFDNLPGETVVAVNSLLRRLRTEHPAPAQSANPDTLTPPEPLAFQIDDSGLTITARRLEHTREPYCILSFQYAPRVHPVAEAAHKIPPDSTRCYSELSELEKELQFTRESLQATVEELETSNEELQSSNEELIASNEELQSTNEELQSVNEELYTVNSEYQNKIEELTRLNNDIQNLMRNSEVGALYLDRNLCIRKTTPAVSDITHIMESDIGRPIYHISLDADGASLLHDIQTVVDSLQPVDREVIFKPGYIHLVRIRPYRTEYNAVDGVVLVFIDITGLKALEDELKSRQQLLEKVLDNSPIAKIMVNSDGRITYVNRKAVLMMHATRDELIGSDFTDERWQYISADGHPVKTSEQPFRLIKKTKQPVANHACILDCGGGHKESVIIHGTPLFTNHNDFEGAVFAMEEAHEYPAQL